MFRIGIGLSEEMKEDETIFNEKSRYVCMEALWYDGVRSKSAFLCHEDQP